MAIKKSRVQHVVAIPYPAQGHINPMLQLCQQLVPHGFTFTFVNTHHIHQRVHCATPIVNTRNGHTRTPQQDACVDDAEHADAHVQANETHADQVELDDTLNVDQQPAKESRAKDAPHEKGHDMQLHKGWNPIRMVFVEGGCAPEDHAHTSTRKEAFLAAQAMKEHVEQLIADIMEEQSVAFVLTDILLGWSNETATKFGLPWVGFWSSSAATCAALIHFADLAKQGKTIPVAGEQDHGEVPTLDDIPGLPATNLHCVPKSWDDAGKLSYEFLEYFHAAESARFVLFNTFVELEGQVLQALCKRYCTLAVGPLLPAFYMNEDVHAHPDRIRSNKEELVRVSLFRENRTCMDWLDKQAPSSVLFISFGSISARTEAQLEELVHGVEASGCPFLWVRRTDISAEVTPGTGLGTGQHGSGLIVPWAPQPDVLAHPAVGGFITHCGWNSTMESVAMGVPMLCWADTTERMSNQRFVVELWKCGLDMVSDGRRYKQHIDEAVLVTREEIEKSIRCLMLEESGAAIRDRAAQLRQSAVSAFLDGHTHFNQFVQVMVQKSFHDH